MFKKSVKCILVFIIFFNISTIVIDDFTYECEYEKTILKLSENDNSKYADKPKLKPGNLININSSPKVELTALPGIGNVLAERITDYREKHGNFECIEDIMKVIGIGEKKFQSIKQYITVE